MTEAPNPTVGILQELFRVANPNDRGPRVLNFPQEDVEKVMGMFDFSPINPPNAFDSRLVVHASSHPSMQGVMIHGVPISFLEGRPAEFKYTIFSRSQPRRPGIE